MKKDVPRRLGKCQSIRPASIRILFGTLTAVLPAQSSQIDIAGPSGSGRFGTAIAVLPNGNVVVTDPSYSLPGAENVGAVHLYDGATHARISTLTGSLAHDRVGSGGVTVLSNGHFVVCSPSWDNGPAADVGAVTWGNGTSGMSGPVSAFNSLVGSAAGDQVGGGGVAALANGHFVVCSPSWDNGPAADVGAATWGNGTSGMSGPVSTVNSLVGGSAGDRVGSGGAIALANGHYVVCSPLWDNGPMADTGAATWGNGTSGVVGMVSGANSLVGGSAGDRVGSGGAIALANGHYVVCSPLWDSGPMADAGAATWGEGLGGVIGPVSGANSLVGSAAGDRVGSGGAIALANGHYVVCSPLWDSGPAADAGAATWGEGQGGVIGPVSGANSLVGGSAGDRVGSGGGLAFANGHYAVYSPSWDNDGATDAGAVTWGDGTAPASGPVSASGGVRGEAMNGGSSMVFAFSTTGNCLVVGCPADNRVSLYVPANPAITATAGPHGVVTPGGIVSVAFGGTTGFVVTADAYYHIENLRTNGAIVVEATGQIAYTSAWVNVTATGTLTAAFAANVTTNTGTPHWWLAQYGLTNFEADAVSDPDRDGMRSWQECMAGTDPTNRISVLRLSRIASESSGNRIVVSWLSTTGVVYRLDRGTNLVNPGAFDIPVRTNIPATPPMNTETDTMAVGGPWFYRVTVP